MATVQAAGATVRVVAAADAAVGMAEAARAMVQFSPSSNPNLSPSP